MTLPTIRNYGNYSSSNYGAHSLCVEVAGITVWYSYTTPIAFRANGDTVVRENDWGPTTGKHLNWIDDDKSIRVPSAEFERLFSEATSPVMA